MKYTRLENLVSTGVTEMLQHPSTIKASCPQYTDKDLHRKWVIDPSTQHYFYSLTEGVNKHLRVNDKNPAQLLYGLVGDYDGEDLKFSSQAERDAVIKAIKKKAPVGWLPTWISRTFSDKVRLVWEFERPFLVQNPAFTDKLLDELAKETKCKTLIPLGGWDPSSLNICQNWEIGEDWEKIAQYPVDAQRLDTVEFNAYRKMRPPAGEVYIPIDVVGREVMQKYPGRWVGDFEIGKRGPLFWIDDGVDRVGAIVQANGMWSFSSRAGKNFVSWSEILGEAFVKKYRDQRLSEAIENVYYDGKHYIMQPRTNNNWMHLNKEQMERRFRIAGFNNKPKSEHDRSSQMDELFSHIEDNHQVSGAAPFVFRFDDVIYQNGNKYINTHSSDRVLQPADTGAVENWPHLFEWFDSMIDPTDGGLGTEVLLSWIKHYYDSAWAGKPKQGHALFLAGDPGKGKSLFSIFTLGKIFKASCDCGDYLMGREPFNGQLSQSPIWYIDDNISASTSAMSTKFGEAIKKFVASPKITVREMYQTPVTLDFSGRIVLTTNLDADALRVIPTLTESIMDKIIFLRMSDVKPWFWHKSQDEIEKIIETELPYFLHYLHNSYQIPASLLKNGGGRFGFDSYQHMELVVESQSLDGFHHVAELIELWWNERGSDQVWSGSGMELYMEIESYETLKPGMKGVTPKSMGERLSVIAAQNNSGVDKLSAGNRIYYKIDLNNR